MESGEQSSAILPGVRHSEPENTAPELRVLYLVDSLRVGGKERQLIEILKSLRGFSFVKPTVVTMGTEEFYVPEIRKLGIPLLYLIRRVRWDPTVFPRLLRILRQCRPHVIDTNSEMSMFYAWPWARH